MATEECEALIESADPETGVVTAVPWHFPAAENIKLPADGGIAAMLAATPRRFDELPPEILTPREWQGRAVLANAYNPSKGIEMTGGTKFLDASDITRAIHEVRALSPASALAGGAAMQIYGSDRLTKDVDFIADGPIPDLPDEGALSFGGYKSHTASGVPVDVIIRSDDYAGLYEEALQNAVHDPELGMPVVSAEYLAAIKMAAGRVKDEEDLRSLILSGNLNVSKTEAIIRNWLGRYGLSSFRSFVEEAKWLAERGR